MAKGKEEQRKSIICLECQNPEIQEAHGGRLNALQFRRHKHFLLFLNGQELAEHLRSVYGAPDEDGSQRATISWYYGTLKLYEKAENWIKEHGR